MKFQKPPAPSSICEAPPGEAPLSLFQERPAGRFFWQIQRTGTLVSTCWGRVGAESPRSTAARCESEQAAIALVEAQISEKTQKGYQPSGWKVSTSRHGVSLTNPELEQAIVADPDDPRHYLVYADWLMERRDPRGELISAACERDEDPDSTRAIQEEERLLREYRDELLGPLAPYAVTHGGIHSRGFEWRRGFIHTARLYGLPPRLPALLRRRLGTELGLPIPKLMRKLFDHPSGHLLHKLIIGAPSDVPGTLAALAWAPKTLVSLVLCENGDGDLGDLSALWSNAERLRELVLFRGEMSLGEVRAPALERLKIAPLATREFFDGFGRAKFPRLEVLHLETVLTPDSLDGPLKGPTAQVMASFFDLDAPKLRTLHLELVGDEIVEPFAESRLARTIEEVVFQWLYPNGIDELERHAETLASIPRISLIDTLEKISAERRRELCNRMPNVQFVPDRRAFSDDPADA